MRFGGQHKRVSREARWRAHVAEVLEIQARVREGANGNGVNGDGANGYGANGHGANGNGVEPPSPERPLMRRFRRDPAMPPGLPLPLRTVTFEELRDLGLTATQATRLLNGRYRGEVSRVDDVRTLTGLPDDVRNTLVRCLTD